MKLFCVVIGSIEMRLGKFHVSVEHYAAENEEAVREFIKGDIENGNSNSTGDTHFEIMDIIQLIEVQLADNGDLKWFVIGDLKEKQQEKE